MSDFRLKTRSISSSIVGAATTSLSAENSVAAIRVRLKTRNIIPFGLLINFGRTLFLLFLPGGALSALLSEGGGVEALMKLPSVFLSLLSSESAQQLLLLLLELLSTLFSDFLLLELMTVLLSFLVLRSVAEYVLPVRALL